MLKTTNQMTMAIGVAIVQARILRAIFLPLLMSIINCCNISHVAAAMTIAMNVDQIIVNI